MPKKLVNAPSKDGIDLGQIQKRFARLLPTFSPQQQRDFEILLALAQRGQEANALATNLYGALKGVFGDQLPAVTAQNRPESSLPPRANRTLHEADKDQIRLDFIYAAYAADLKLLSSDVLSNRRTYNEIRDAQCIQHGLDVDVAKGHRTYGAITNTLHPFPKHKNHLKRLLKIATDQNKRDRFLKGLAQYWDKPINEILRMVQLSPPPRPIGAGIFVYGVSFERRRIRG